MEGALVCTCQPQKAEPLYERRTRYLISRCFSPAKIAISREIVDKGKLKIIAIWIALT